MVLWADLCYRSLDPAHNNFIDIHSMLCALSSTDISDNVYCRTEAERDLNEELTYSIYRLQ